MQAEHACVCAGCLGQLGLLGNAILQFMYMYVLGLLCEARLAVPSNWSERSYFTRLKDSSAVDVVPHDQMLSLPVMCDRVVLAHPGFKCWISGHQPYAQIQKALGVHPGVPLSGRQLRKMFPQVAGTTLRELAALQQEQQQKSEETQIRASAWHQHDLVQLVTSSQLWGFFQVHTSQLAPFKKQLIQTLEMSNHRLYTGLLMGALRSFLGMPGLQRKDVRLIVCHLRRTFFSTATEAAPGARLRPLASQAGTAGTCPRCQPLAKETHASTSDSEDSRAGGKATGISAVSLGSQAPAQSCAPPWETGPQNSWRDTRGVFTICPESWFTQALLTLSPPPALIHLVAPGPVLDPAPCHAAGDDSGGAAVQASLSNIQQTQTPCPRVDVLWLCSNDSKLLQNPHIHDMPALSWHAALLQHHLTKAAQELQASGDQNGLSAILDAEGGRLVVDDVEADFWIMREADVLLASSSTFSFAAAMLSHNQHNASCQPKSPGTQSCDDQHPPHEPIFMRPDVSAGGFVMFDPWDSIPLLPSKPVPGNHILHRQAHPCTYGSL